MRRRSRDAYLWDILDSCHAILDFTRGRSLTDYESDRMLHRAVERELSIVGEAINQLTRSFPEMTTAIGPVRQIVGFRNRLIHEYADVEIEVIWAIVQDQIPPLLARAEVLLNGEQDAT